MKTTIVSRVTGTGRRRVPVYQVRYADNGAVEMFWYGANEELIPFSGGATADEASDYLARARLQPDAHIETIDS
jgi:hypothetical protein